MKKRALILGLIALAGMAEAAAAQGGKGGGNSNKVDSVTGIVISPPSGGAGPTVKWNSIDKATFQVQRSKSGDTCCNNSSAAGLTTTSWQDGALPSSGTYLYKVTATTNSGQVVGNSQFSYTAPAPPPAPAPAPAPIVTAPVAPAPITTVTTVSPITAIAQPILVAPAPAPEPAPVTAVLAAPATATGMVTTVSGGEAMAAPVSGRYRVTMTGVMVAKPTADDPLDRDGKADEIFANSIVIRVDRSTGSRLGTTIVKSREYGDVGNGSTWPYRIRAGTAIPSGGLTVGNAVPFGFVPSSPSGSPSAETFPLVLWEGTLTDGGEAVILFPSLWERDIDDIAYKNYAANWMNNLAPVLGTALIKNQYSSTALMPIMGPTDPATFGLAAAGAPFTMPNFGVYAIPAISLVAPVDRPIGMMTVAGALAYVEHIVVVTREKLADLQVGGTKDLQIPLIEAAVGTDGVYTMYIRVERIG